LINRFTIDPPIVKQSGDVITIVGKRLEQWRDDVLLRVVDLTAPQKLTDIATVGGETISELYLEVGMIGQSVTMTNVRENQNTGAIIVDFSSGTQLEFANWEAVGEIAANIDSTSDLAEKILLGKAYRESPDGTNKTTQLGASVSTNLLAANPIVYNGPE
jgi:hypothetical protein